MTNEPNEADYRLPRSSVPRRYGLRLTPDLAAATFLGEEDLELEILEATDQVVMNASELSIPNANIGSGWTSAGDTLGDSESGSIAFDVERERVTFSFPSPLVPGRYTLSCSFTGVLNDQLSGFYRSTFVDDEGHEHTIATTQFEETDAHKAFPCFDEPDRKAVFSITLDVPSSMTAVSNGPEVESIDLDGGRRRVRFGDTIPMSTYLVAMIVGPLEASDPVDVDGVALRVYTVPGKLRLAGHALQAGTHALRFFTDYFAIPYPGEKLDLLALPDFAAGAMENLGCVTFREAILLADPDNASRGELERLAEVVEHEIAHMWFGDLVTMRWWNGIWLNEAFATFMALCCQDDFHPEWESFVSFGRSKAAAFAIDGLHSTRPIEFPVRHPDEAAAMFDVLTYEKGASVLWMIEHFLGRDSFRAGVRRYLQGHLYSNTETTDLWDAIEQEAGDIPIRAIMDSWIFQGGFPLILASTSTDAEGKYQIRQQPFSYLPREEGVDSSIGRDWLVPIVAAPVGDLTAEIRTILGTASKSLSSSSAPLVINAGGSGFFRVGYDDQQHQAILVNFISLSAIERFNFVADTWALVLAGQRQLERFIEISNILSDERDPHVWSVMIGALATLDLLAREDVRDNLAEFTRALLGPQLERVGWEKRPDDDEQTPLLRSSLISMLGTIGRDSTVIGRAHELFAKDHHENITIDADLASAVLGIVAATASESEFADILARYRNPLNPNDELRHLNAFAMFTNPAYITQVHEMCLGEIRSQNAPYLLGSMLRNRAANQATWAFISSHFDELVARFPANSIHRMLDGISALAQLDEDGEPILADEVRAFCEANIKGARRRQVEQSLERLAINLRLAQVLRGELPAAINR